MGDSPDSALTSQKRKHGYLQKCSRLGTFQCRWFTISRHGVLSYYSEDKTTLRQQYSWFNLLTDKVDRPETDLLILVRVASDRGCSCVSRLSSSATDRRLLVRAESTKEAAAWKHAVAAASAQRGSFGFTEQLEQLPVVKAATEGGGFQCRRGRWVSLSGWLEGANDQTTPARKFRPTAESVAYEAQSVNIDSNAYEASYWSSMPTLTMKRLFSIPRK